MIPKQEQKERHRWVVGSGRWEPAKYTRWESLVVEGWCTPCSPLPLLLPQARWRRSRWTQLNNCRSGEAGPRPDT